jgi:hypothetical protein
MRWIAIFVLSDPLAEPAVSSDAPKPGYGKNQTRDDLEQKASAEQISLCELTWEASRYFERSELDQAARCYEQILLAFPDDPAAKVLLATYSTNVPVKGIGPISRYSGLCLENPLVPSGGAKSPMIFRNVSNPVTLNMPARQTR